jgi:hypothetical protein
VAEASEWGNNELLAVDALNVAASLSGVDNIYLAAVVVRGDIGSLIRPSA